MKSEWKILKNPMLEEKPFRVYRLIDKDKPKHSGNVEYLEEFETDDRQAALEMAYTLNALEKW